MSFAADGNYQIVQYYAIPRSQLSFESRARAGEDGGDATDSGSLDSFGSSDERATPEAPVPAAAAAESSAVTAPASRSASPTPDLQASESVHATVAFSASAPAGAFSASPRLQRLCLGLAQQNAVMESVILSELANYISTHRIAVLESFRAAAAASEHTLPRNLLSIAEWQQCLRLALRLPIDFAQYASQLGVLQVASGALDFEAFASKYRPVHIELMGMNEDDDLEDSAADEDPIVTFAPVASAPPAPHAGPDDSPSRAQSAIATDASSAFPPVLTLSSSTSSSTSKSSSLGTSMAQLSEFLFQFRTELVAMFRQFESAGHGANSFVSCNSFISFHFLHALFLPRPLLRRSQSCRIQRRPTRARARQAVRGRAAKRSQVATLVAAPRHGPRRVDYLLGLCRWISDF